ncbi:ACP S-malonyltransferase [Candidatus Daviesbacteria bacterium]|nr:ACP S-malonyltransferase [Candidatus Daviesbacteria bacterium]
MVEQKGHVLLFPGQGSQARGMGEELYNNSLAAQAVFDDADKICKRLGLPYRITEVCFQDPLGQLNGENSDTAVIQPCLLTYGVAAHRVLEELKVPPASLSLVHSAGKYTALAATGALDLEEAIHFVSTRGVVMKEAKADIQAAVVVVVGLESERILEELAKARKQLGIQEGELFFDLSSLNTRIQSMLVGPKRFLVEVTENLIAAGARQVEEYKDAIPSHYTGLAEAQRRLNEFKLHLRAPKMPLLDDITNRALESIEDINIAVETHLISPVFWRGSLLHLNKNGYQCGLEMGPGVKLKNMAKRECPKVLVLPTSSWKDIQAIKRELSKTA